ncbi:hypothetical protein BC567DRAFT_265303 [Phyllosticta citribraziliensis]
MNSNNDEVAESYAKIEALEEKITKLQRAVCAEIAMLSAKRAHFQRLNQDLDELAEQSLGMLQDEALLVSMMKEKEDGQSNRSKLDGFTEKAEDMVVDVSEEMETASYNNHGEEHQPNKISVEELSASCTKVASPEEKLSETRESIKVKLNELEALRAYYLRRSKDIEHSAQQSIEPLRDESNIADMIKYFGSSGA